MPTENEKKYVLELDCEKQIANLANRKKILRQGYLEQSHIRVRKIEMDKKQVFELCYKHHFPERLIEIETTIDERDFNDLWSIASCKLIKTRYDIVIKKKLWEVDFFKTPSGRVYFVQAEHEMPEHQLNPHFIPDIITKHLVYEVPHSDGRFASRKLWNIEYAEKLYKIVQKKEIT